MSYREEFLQKHFFRKLQMILNIFHIHNICSKSLVFELQVIEIAHENTILAKTRTKIATRGFTEMTVGMCFLPNQVSWSYYEPLKSYRY